MKYPALTSLGLAILLVLARADVFVDNVAGDDANDGSAAKPARTIAQGLKLLRTGETLHLKPNPVPYNEKVEIRDRRLAGTAERPTVFDGHGAVLDRLRRPDPSAWKDEGDGVFTMPLPNNAWVMDQQGYWSGFPIVRFDAKPAEWRKSRKELEPLTCFLSKVYVQGTNERGSLHNLLHVRLPPGKTPAEVRVEVVGELTSFFVGVDHVTVRNLTSINSTQDGFATAGGKGIVFEKVRGTANMDQGMSHHGAEVTVRNSRFDGNAGGGVVDVYDTCRTRYFGCVIEGDVFRGGVEFHKGEFEMRDCVIRSNPNTSLSVAKGARVRLRNCLITGGSASKVGVSVGSDASLDMENCTLEGFSTGLSAAPGAKVRISRCALSRCTTLYALGSFEGLAFDENLLSPGVIRAGDKEYVAEAFARFVADSGLERKSRFEAAGGPAPSVDSPVGAGPLNPQTP